MEHLKYLPDHFTNHTDKYFISVHTICNQDKVNMNKGSQFYQGFFFFLLTRDTIDREAIILFHRNKVLRRCPAKF